MKSEETSWRHPENKLKTIFHRCKSHFSPRVIDFASLITGQKHRQSWDIQHYADEHVYWACKKKWRNTYSQFVQMFLRNSKNIIKLNCSLSLLIIVFTFPLRLTHAAAVCWLRTSCCQHISSKYNALLSNCKLSLARNVMLFDSVKILTGKSIKFGENSQSSKQWSFNLSNGRIRCKLKGQLKFIHQKKWTVNMIMECLNLRKLDFYHNWTYF